VYASRVGENGVEIVWQRLVDFSSVTVGKMFITVSDTGLVATRGAGDSSKGFGTVSRKPLSGEDVLVRRLADAVAQATEKGLARKVRSIVSMKLHVPQSGSPHRCLLCRVQPIASKPKEAPVSRGPVSSIQSSGTVDAMETAPSLSSAAAPTAVIEPESPASDIAPEQGPRQSGARRSTERPRGKRRRDGGGDQPKP
jgi:hypothetical protein